VSRALTDLCPSIRPAAEAVVLFTVERRHFCLIVDTLRTKTEQRLYLQQGVSWTLRSKHLPQVACEVCANLYNSEGYRGLSHAIDLAPLAEYMAHGHQKVDWDAANPIWREIGESGEQHGLDWGGYWQTPDLGHLQSTLPFLGEDPE
jgi:hypothetical protein